jgi:WD40 repeat protein
MSDNEEFDDDVDGGEFLDPSEVEAELVGADASDVPPTDDEGGDDDGDDDEQHDDDDDDDEDENDKGKVDGGNEQQVDEEGEDGEEEENVEVEDVEPVRIDASATFRAHTSSVYCVAANPVFEDVVASGGGDDRAFLWSADDALLAHELRGHTDSVVACGFSVDGSLLATGALDNTVRVWDVEDGSCVATLDGPTDGVQWVDWHPKGHVVVAGSDDSTVWMWMSGGGGKYMQMFTGHTAPVTGGKFTWDGKSLVTVSEDASLRVWNPKTGAVVHIVAGHPFHSAEITTLALHGARPLCATGGMDNLVCVSHHGTGRALLALRGHTDSVECVAWAASKPGQAVPPYASMWLASGSVDGDAKLWDCEAGQCVRTFKGHESTVVRVAFTSHGGNGDASSLQLVTASADRTVRVWDARQASSVRVLHGHRSAILDGTLTKSGLAFVSVGDDKSGMSFLLDDVHPHAAAAAAAPAAPAASTTTTAN